MARSFARRDCILAQVPCCATYSFTELLEQVLNVTGVLFILHWTLLVSVSETRVYRNVELVTSCKALIGMFLLPYVELCYRLEAPENPLRVLL